MRDLTPRTIGNWWMEYLKGEPGEGRWQPLGGTLWSPHPMTGREYIGKTLASAEMNEPVWARAFCIPMDLGSHYDLHYPDGVETPVPRTPGALGPHLWVPAPEAYYLAGQRHATYEAALSRSENPS